MVRIIVVMIGLLLFSPVAFGCSCGPIPDLVSRVHDAEMVFAGRVKQIIPRINQDGDDLAIFQVYKIFKDDKTNQGEVQVLFGGECDAWYEKGEEYVLFLRRDNNTFNYYRTWGGMCGGSSRYGEEISRELETLTPEVVDRKLKEKEQEAAAYEERAAKAADEVILEELKKCNDSPWARLQGRVELTDYKRTSKRYDWIYGSQGMGFSYDYSKPGVLNTCSKHFFVKITGRGGSVLLQV